MLFKLPYQPSQIVWIFWNLYERLVFAWSTGNKFSCHYFKQFFLPVFTHVFFSPVFIFLSTVFAVLGSKNLFSNPIGLFGFCMRCGDASSFRGTFRWRISLGMTWKVKQNKLKGLSICSRRNSVKSGSVRAGSTAFGDRVFWLVRPLSVCWY